MTNLPTVEDWEQAVKEIILLEYNQIKKRVREIAEQRHKDAMQHYINNEI